MPQAQTDITKEMKVKITVGAPISKKNGNPYNRMLVEVSPKYQAMVMLTDIELEHLQNILSKATP